MLVLKVFVNQEQIDEIHIQNTGETHKRGYFSYVIKSPEGYDKESIVHQRSAGYESLVIMALHKIMHKKKS
jgi:2-hydroxy-3-keto-5-methylthiopentenyl-1-phosphate phosphatase